VCQAEISPGLTPELMLLITLLKKSCIFTGPAKPVSVTQGNRENHCNADHEETKSDAQEMREGLLPRRDEFCHGGRQEFRSSSCPGLK